MWVAKKELTIDDIESIQQVISIVLYESIQLFLHQRIGMTTYTHLHLDNRISIHIAQHWRHLGDRSLLWSTSSSLSTFAYWNRQRDISRYLAITNLETSHSSSIQFKLICINAHTTAKNPHLETFIRHLESIMHWSVLKLDDRLLVYLQPPCHTFDEPYKQHDT